MVRSAHMPGGLRYRGKPGNNKAAFSGVNNRARHSVRVCKARLTIAVNGGEQV
jgi:hypothetical protein